MRRCVHCGEGLTALQHAHNHLELSIYIHGELSEVLLELMLRSGGSQVFGARASQPSVRGHTWLIVGGSLGMCSVGTLFTKPKRKNVHKKIT